jgi:hypothetical protein
MGLGLLRVRLVQAGRNAADWVIVTGVPPGSNATVALRAAVRDGFGVTTSEKEPPPSPVPCTASQVGSLLVGVHDLVQFAGSAVTEMGKVPPSPGIGLGFPNVRLVQTARIAGDWAIVTEVSPDNLTVATRTLVKEGLAVAVIEKSPLPVPSPLVVSQEESPLIGLQGVVQLIGSAVTEM